MELPLKSTVRINDREQSLADLHRDAWKQLTSAPAQKKNGFKTCTVATVSAGGLPDARTVVLRQADETTHTLWFHTDLRAEKVSQLRAHPDATLLFWDDHRQVQLRCRIRTTLHTDDAVADQQWAKTWEGSRKMYLSAYEPGSVRPEPYPGFPPELGDRLPSRAESEAGRINFAVVECQVLTIDYLHLSRSGQTRARFVYEGEGKREWLAP